MPDHNFKCGDIVVCSSPYYANQLQIGGQQGIVMGTKPHHIHVWFEEQNRGFWLTYDLLRKIEDGELSPLLKRVQLLTYLLDAEEWELEESPGPTKLICYVDRVSFETMMEIRNYLDFDYRSLIFYPEGMGRMIAQIEWNKDT
jgi:hypothetical protein